MLDDRYDSLFQWYGSVYSIDWRLLKAQVKQESNFDPDARSKVGALGLAQFMRRTFEEAGPRSAGIPFPVPDTVLLDPRDPEDAIRAQAWMMVSLIKSLGSIEFALAAYNWGYGHLAKLRENSNAVYDQLASRMPAETQEYVYRVMNNYLEYIKESHKG